MYRTRVVPVESTKFSQAGYLELLKQTFDQDSGTTQPPSAFSKAIALSKIELISNGWRKEEGDKVLVGPAIRISCQIDVDRDLVNEVAATWNNDEMITHRSRISAVGFKMTQWNEVQTRLARSELRAEVEVDSRLQEIATDAWAHTLGQAIKKLRIGDHTETYVKEHSTSSVIPGMKWEDVDAGQMKSILAACKEHLESRMNYFEQGVPAIIDPADLNFGQRARSPPLPSADIKDEYEFDVTRTRIVLYSPGMSAVNAFLSKAEVIAWYRQAFERMADALGVEVLSPVTHGGEYYVKLAELLQDNQYIATDGVNWEQNLPSILPDIVAYTYIGAWALPSGAFDTSEVGGLGSCCIAPKVASKIQGHVKAFCIQGDDLGVIYSGSSGYKGIPYLSSLDLMDTRLKFNLGYSYVEPMKFHPIGIKLSADSADKMHPIKIGGKAILTRKLSNEEIRVTIGIYKGELDDGRTLVDVMKSIEADTDNWPRRVLSKLTEALVDEQRKEILESEQRSEQPESPNGTRGDERCSVRTLIRDGLGYFPR
jgi:hypothetical protein